MVRLGENRTENANYDCEFNILLLCHNHPCYCRYPGNYYTTIARSNQVTFLVNTSTLCLASENVLYCNLSYCMPCSCTEFFILASGCLSVLILPKKKIRNSFGSCFLMMFPVGAATRQLLGKMQWAYAKWKMRCEQKYLNHQVRTKAIAHVLLSAYWKYTTCYKHSDWYLFDPGMWYTNAFSISPVCYVPSMHIEHKATKHFFYLSRHSFC